MDPIIGARKLVWGLACRTFLLVCSSDSLAWTPSFEAPLIQGPRPLDPILGGRKLVPRDACFTIFQVYSGKLLDLDTLIRGL